MYRYIGNPGFCFDTWHFGKAVDRIEVNNTAHLVVPVYFNNHNMVFSVENNDHFRAFD